jgi:hypothetical protein
MTEEQQKIKFLIDMYHAPNDYRDFHTAEECYDYLNNRSKIMHANRADKTMEKIREFADLSSNDLDAWVDIFEEYSCSIGHDSTRQYKLFVDLYENKKIPSGVQFPLLMDIYINNNVLDGYHKYFLESYDNYPINLKENLRIDLHMQINNYIDKEGNFTIYRGEYINAINGSSININQAISFTFDYNIARKFACRKCPEKAYIYTAKVSFDNIIYFTDGREEKEVLVRPVDKGGQFLELKCEEVNPKEYFKY